MQHTFILKPGTWSATGTCFNAEGKSTQVRGSTTIHHEPSEWTLDGWMEWNDASGSVVKNRYQFRPFAPGECATSWVCDNPVLGRLHGTITIVDNSILMEYQSESGGHHGAEFLLHISDEMYLNRGALFRKNAIVSSWAVILTAEGSGISPEKDAGISYNHEGAEENEKYVDVNCPSAEIHATF